MSDPNTLALLGAVNVPGIRFLDGTSRDVRVSQVKLSLMEEYRQAYASNNESKMIKIATGMPEDLIDKLTIDSIETLITTIQAVNKDFFFRWMKRLAIRSEEIMPGSAKDLQHLLAYSSPTTSPESPSGAA